jgi:hypothetical protein
VKTCPGASAQCLALCYAQTGHFHMSSVKEAHWRNLEYAEDPKFVRWMTSCLRRNLVQILRIHVAGDYFSNEYIEKWIEVMRRSPRVTFYSYTRSWAVPSLVKKLKELALVRNHQLWLSYDKVMSAPPRWAGIKTCYMSADDKDLPRSKADLVFRDQKKTVMKFTPRGSLVCPFEQGTKPKVQFTCASCQICFKDKDGQKDQNKKDGLRLSNL